MKISLRHSIPALLAMFLCLGVISCARAPRDPGVWKTAAERAAHEWIKTDPHLIARLGNVTKIDAGKVEWDKEKTHGGLFWTEPEHIRLVSYSVNGPKGKFEVRIITQGRGDKAEVIYWAWRQ